MPTAAERLHEAAALHDARVAALPYARALAEDQLPPERQASLVRALAIMYDELARLLASAPDARAAIDARRALLGSAMAALHIDRRQVDEAALAALLFAQRARLAAAEAPQRLLGFVAALDAARLERLVPAAALSASAPAAVDDPTLASALLALDALERVIGAAGRRPRSAELLATELNADAGMHPIPTDLREVEAALLAGEDTWGHFEYYAARYGEHGRRFTTSDAAWLATLARDDATVTSRQVHWLAALLANRGMPRVTMERHLRHLAATLTARVPERAALYRSLDAAAHELHEERTAAIPEETARDLVGSFAGELSREARLSPTEAGTLILSAVSDEAMNVADAVRALVAWLAEPARFSTRWRDAVAQLVTVARAAALR